jgi:hypothetical protein
MGDDMVPANLEQEIKRSGEFILENQKLLIFCSLVQSRPTL